MKRLAPLLLLGPLLMACPATTAPLSSLQDAALDLGPNLSASLRQAYVSSWTVTSAPDWVSLSPASGTGTSLNTVVSVDRSRTVGQAADRPRLSGTLVLAWSSPDGTTSGTARVTVNADLYRLSGQLAGLPVQAAVVQEPGVRAGQPGAARPEARSYIVRYRTPAAAQTGAAQADSRRPGAADASAQPALRQLDTRLEALNGVSGVQQRGGDLRRLRATPAGLAAVRADPAVLYAVPDYPVQAQQLQQAQTETLQQAQILQQTQSLQQAQSLQTVEPLTPPDELVPLQWPFRLLGYPAVWRDMAAHPYTRPVTVAVIDSGVRYDHPDLAGALYRPGEGALDLLEARDDSGRDNGDGDGPDTDPTDPATPNRSDPSHGTHVTGLIVARSGSFPAPCAGCSSSGVVGAAYSAPVMVLPIRVLDAPGGSGNESDVADAIRYAAGEPLTRGGQTYTNPHPAQVINLSLGSPITASEAQPLCEAVTAATARGALVVAAGGNTGGATPYYPAACEGAVAVAAVTLTAAPLPARAYYSEQYDQIALSAPGGAGSNTTYNGGVLNGAPFQDGVLSTGWNYARNQPNYVSESGTSQATPQVTALAALLLSKGVVTTPRAAYERLVATATDLGVPGRDAQTGYGLINPATALGAAPISDTPGLTVTGPRGVVYTPPLDALGRFDAWLPAGQFTLLAGRDRNGNGLAGETGEPRATASATLSPRAPITNLGLLTLNCPQC